jgi:hypothetical protein
MVSPWPDRAFRAAAPQGHPFSFVPENDSLFVLAGLVPAIHVFPVTAATRRGCPGQSPGMTNLKPNSFRQPQRRDLAARCARVLIQRPALLDQRARGMPGADAPAAARGVVVARALVTAGGTGITRHSPRNGFNGLLRALLGDRACLPPSPAKSLSADLTPASGCQDHTASPSAAGIARQARRPRPPHPAPTSVTLRNAPFEWGGTKSL